MTLIELLVVLSILALLTAVAVTSSDVFVSQGRYEATVKTLTNVQEAVLGPPNARQADGTLVSMGFVADVGRPPQCTSTDPTLGLSELWTLPAGVSLFALQPASDPQVVVPCGWNGPYLRLPVGQSNLCDGWGNPFNLLDSSGSLAGVGEPIATVQSNGGGSGPYAVSSGSVSLQPSPIAIAGSVKLTGSDALTTSSPITVKLFGPNPSTGGVQELTQTVTATEGLASFSFPTVYAPGFVRAYLGVVAPYAPPGATPASNIVQFLRSKSGITLYLASP